MIIGVAGIPGFIEIPKPVIDRHVYLTVQTLCLNFYEIRVFNRICQCIIVRHYQLSIEWHLFCTCVWVGDLHIILGFTAEWDNGRFGCVPEVPFIPYLICAICMDNTLQNDLLSAPCRVVFGGISLPWNANHFCWCSRNCWYCRQHACNYYHSENHHYHVSFLFVFHFLLPPVRSVYIIAPLFGACIEPNLRLRSF